MVRRIRQTWTQARLHSVAVGWNSWIYFPWNSSTDTLIPTDPSPLPFFFFASFVFWPRSHSFPIQEYGMNWDSSPLQPHEIQTMTDDPVIMQRLVASYRLMLHFYGMHLESEDSGLLVRSTNYADRYRNLSRSSHNNLRISRILKCLSEFGLERFNTGFLLHVLNEQSENNNLNTPGIKSSMDRWWANCLRNTEDREWIQETIGRVRQNDGFVFTRDMYTGSMQRRQITGSLRNQEPPSVAA